MQWVSWNFDKRRTPAQAVGSNSFISVNMSRPITELQPIVKNEILHLFLHLAVAPLCLKPCIPTSETKLEKRETKMQASPQTGYEFEFAPQLWSKLFFWSFVINRKIVCVLPSAQVWNFSFSQPNNQITTLLHLVPVSLQPDAFLKPYFSLSSAISFFFAARPETPGTPSCRIRFFQIPQNSDRLTNAPSCVAGLGSVFVRWRPKLVRWIPLLYLSKFAPRKLALAASGFHDNFIAP